MLATSRKSHTDHRARGRIGAVAGGHPSPDPRAALGIAATPKPIAGFTEDWQTALLEEVSEHAVEAEVESQGRSLPAFLCWACDQELGITRSMLADALNAAKPRQAMARLFDQGMATLRDTLMQAAASEGRHAGIRTDSACGIVGVLAVTMDTGEDNIYCVDEPTNLLATTHTIAKIDLPSQRDQADKQAPVLSAYDKAILEIETLVHAYLPLESTLSITRSIVFMEYAEEIAALGKAALKSQEAGLEAAKAFIRAIRDDEEMSHYICVAAEVSDLDEIEEHELYALAQLAATVEYTEKCFEAHGKQPLMDTIRALERTLAELPDQANPRARLGWRLLMLMRQYHRELGDKPPQYDEDSWLQPLSDMEAPLDSMAHIALCPLAENIQHDKWEMMGQIGETPVLRLSLTHEDGDKVLPYLRLVTQLRIIIIDEHERG